MKRFTLLLMTALMLGQFGFARGPHKHDPLTVSETDQIREAADKPPDKLKLFLGFAKARLLAIGELRTDPKFSEGRGQKIHDLLDDFNIIVNELEDNLEDFADHREYVVKPTRQIIESTADFQLRLRTLKDAPSSDKQAAEEAKEYRFILDTSLDSVNSLAESARAILDEQLGVKPREQPETKPRPK